MTDTPRPLYIRAVKRIVFRDMTGHVLKEYAIGDKIEWFSKLGHYWVTAAGGVYFDEAEELVDDIDQWKGPSDAPSAARWKGPSDDQWKGPSDDQWKGPSDDQWKGPSDVD